MPPDPNKPVFIFDTHGDWQATKFGNFLWNTRGEYIGYLEGEDVYKRDGEWIGRLSKDGRILRKRSEMRRELQSECAQRTAQTGKTPAARAAAADDGRTQLQHCGRVGRRPGNLQAHF